MPPDSLRAVVSRNARNTLVVLVPTTLFVGFFVAMTIVGIVTPGAGPHPARLAFLAGVAALFVVCVRKIARTVASRRDPIRDLDVARICKRLGLSFDALAARIDPELPMAKQFGDGRVRMLSWCLYAPDLFAFDVVRFEDVVWAYGRVTKRSVNFIPLGRTFEVRLHTQQREHLVYPLDLLVAEGDSERLIARIREAAPWAHIGFDTALDRDWIRRYATVASEVAARQRAMQSLRG